MRRLILVKHARPLVDPKRSSEQWKLSDEGRAACGPLADALGAFELNTIISSTEPKAVETSGLVAARLNRRVRQFDDLHEHDRRNVPHMESREFISMMALFFREPRRRVLGAETADNAYERFGRAVDRAVEEESGDVAIVTHGTVIALFAERRAHEDAFTLWRRMGLPSFLVLEVPTWTVSGVRERVG